MSRYLFIRPLLEAKFDTDIDNVMERTVSKKVEFAVDSYVSSAEFQQSLAESISFSFKSRVEKKLQRVEGLMIQSGSKSDVKYDDLERYRRNNIRFYRIKEGEHVEGTNKITVDVLSNLDLDISPNDICRSYRVGRKSSDPSKPRQIIVKLVRHDVKAAIMRKHKILRERNPEIGVNEDLKKGKMMAIRKLKEAGSSNTMKIWAVDGTINMKKNNPNTIILVGFLQHFDKVLQDICI